MNYNPLLCALMKLLYDVLLLLMLPIVQTFNKFRNRILLEIRGNTKRIKRTRSSLYAL